VIVSVVTSLDAGPAAVSDAAGAPGALVTAPVLRQASLALAGAPGGDRPPGGRLAGRDEVRWPARDLPPATRIRPFDSAARGLVAAGLSLAAVRPAPGSAAIAPPRGLGLIGDALPLFQDTLERSFDRFLSRIKDLGAGTSSTLESPDRWIPWLLLAVTAGAGALGRWRRWGSDDGDGHMPDAPCPEGKLGRHGLPGLPRAR
jgi:hypothetical protein